MHKFIDNIVAFSLKNKFLYILLYGDCRYSRSRLIQTYADRCLSGCNEYKSDDHHAMGGP